MFMVIDIDVKVIDIEVRAIDIDGSFRTEHSTKYAEF